MALTTKQLLNYSWMSQASYLEFTGLLKGTSGAVLEGKLTNTESINAHNIFADEQAKLFTGSNTASDPTNEKWGRSQFSIAF